MARRQRQDHGQIGCRLVQLQTAHDVDIRIAACHDQAAALLQHGHQQHRAVIVDAVGVSARSAEARRRDERLDLRQDRPCSFHHSDNAGARRIGRTSGKEHFRGVFHLAESLVVHFKNADLIGGAEAVFCRAQDPVALALIALEIQHAVHHVFQNFGSCDAAFLVDVTDDKRREALILGRAHDPHRAFPHLADAAGRGVGVGVKHGLDGIDDQNGRVQLVDGAEHGRDIRLCKDIDLSAVHPEALRAHFDLALALLAGDVKDPFLTADLSAELQQQRGFSDPRRAADQHDRTAHGAAAEHAVKLRNAGGKSKLLFGLQLRDFFWLGESARCADGDGFRLLRRFGQRIPCAAGGTLAHPFGGLVAAFGAVKGRFTFFHWFHPV